MAGAVGTLRGGAGSAGGGGTRGGAVGAAVGTARGGGVLLRRMETSGRGTGAGVGLGILGRLGMLGAAGGLARLVSKVVSCVSASTWLLVSGVSGELAEGFLMAVTMSWTPAMIKSVDEARGIGILDGNHEMVSQMRDDRVSTIQTL
jgi:hypothetical protein